MWGRGPTGGAAPLGERETAEPRHVGKQDLSGRPRLRTVHGVPRAGRGSPQGVQSAAVKLFHIPRGLSMVGAKERGHRQSRGAGAGLVSLGLDVSVMNSQFYSR